MCNVISNKFNHDERKIILTGFMKFFFKFLTNVEQITNIYKRVFVQQ